MKVYKYNKRDTRFPPWTALCVLSLLAAMVFAVPSVVFAQTYELSQDCETAMVGTDHTITVEVTDENGAPVAGVSLWYSVQGANFGIRAPIVLPTNEHGITEFTYTGGTLGADSIWLIPPPPNSGTLATISTEWTTEDLCSSSPKVLVLYSTLAVLLATDSKRKPISLYESSKLQDTLLIFLVMIRLVVEHLCGSQVKLQMQNSGLWIS